MNPVAMTIINPRKEYWPSRGSNQRPPVLKSATLQTELWGLALHLVMEIHFQPIKKNNSVVKELNGIYTTKTVIRIAERVLHGETARNVCSLILLRTVRKNTSTTGGRERQCQSQISSCCLQLCLYLALERRARSAFHICAAQSCTALFATL